MDNDISLFQYIPCYCLSADRVCTPGEFCGFQYIPCYCLSSCKLFQIILVISFQYIPCYCLSKALTQCLYQWHYFNTSHVTVYLGLSDDATKTITFQYIPCYCLSLDAPQQSHCKPISIHPMLLFIVFINRHTQKKKEISIHPMLLFIGGEQ